LSPIWKINQSSRLRHAFFFFYLQIERGLFAALMIPTEVCKSNVSAFRPHVIFYLLPFAQAPKWLGNVRKQKMPRYAGI
jgi:hypothetical protein